MAKLERPLSIILHSLVKKKSGEKLAKIKHSLQVKTDQNSYMSGIFVVREQRDGKKILNKRMFFPYWYRKKNTTFCTTCKENMFY